MSEKETISFSEAYTFSKCPYNHYLQYVLKQRKGDTIHTIFGSLLGRAIEKRKKYGIKNSWIELGKGIAQFHLINNETKKEYQPWIRTAFSIYNEVFDWMDKEFPGHELIDFEYKLLESIPDHKLKFKGYIDIIIKWNNKIYILDFKTTSWGWGIKEMSDTEKLYQVTLYKKFYSQNHGIDPKNIETGYILLKKKPPKDKPRIELINTTSGTKKMENATSWLKQCADGIEKGVRIKTSSTCQFCTCKK